MGDDLWRIGHTHPWETPAKFEVIPSPFGPFLDFGKEFWAVFGEVG